LSVNRHYPTSTAELSTDGVAPKSRSVAACSVKVRSNRLNSAAGLLYSAQGLGIPCERRGLTSRSIRFWQVCDDVSRFGRCGLSRSIRRRGGCPKTMRGKLAETGCGERPRNKEHGKNG